jgi:hypothetical protein
MWTETVKQDWEELRDVLQSIIEEVLPEWATFDVSNFNKVQTEILFSLLTEEDEEKRNKIWEDINGRIEKSRKWLKNSYKQVLCLAEQIEAVKSSRTQLSEFQQQVLDWDDKILDEINNLA